MLITSEGFAEWKRNDVTREVFKVLRERQAKVGKLLGMGNCLGNEPKHGELSGRYQEIEDLLEMKYDDMKEDKT